MRLSGLAAGIATFAVLEITQNILGNWERIGPGPLTLSTVPQTTDLWQATIGAIAVACVAFAYQLCPLGRKLRATREDPFAAQAAGIDVHRQRLWAFTLSGRWPGSPAGSTSTCQSTIDTDIYLDFTFLTLAMLVVGGSRSLWGAVVGALVISGLVLVPLRRGDRRRQWLHLARRDGARRRRRLHGGRAALPAARADRRPRIRLSPELLARAEDPDRHLRERHPARRSDAPRVLHVEARAVVLR